MVVNCPIDEIIGELKTLLGRGLRRKGVKIKERNG